MQKSALAFLLGFALTLNAWPAEQKNKEEELVTQTREIPREPPAALAVETSRLVFRVSPLTIKGLLLCKTVFNPAIHTLPNELRLIIVAPVPQKPHHVFECDMRFRIQKRVNDVESLLHIP